MFNEFFVGRMLKSKLQRNFGKVFLLLVIISVVSGLSTVILSITPIQSYYNSQGGGLTTYLINFLTYFGLSLVMGLFMMFLITLVVTILGGKGTLYEGLCVLVYSQIVPVLGMLIFSVVYAILVNVKLAAIIYTPVLFVSVGIVIVSIAIEYAMMLRGIKELFNVDMITSFLATTTMMGAIIVGGIFVFMWGYLSYLIM